MAGPSINDSADAPVGPSPAAHATPGAHRVHPPGRPGPDGEEDAAAPAAHVAPGAYMVYPSGHPGTDAEEDAPVTADVEPVFEGFLPPMSPNEIARREAEEMLRNSITLDPAAVRPVADPPRAGEAAVEGSCLKRPGAVVSLTVLAIAAVAFGVAYGGAGNANEEASSAAVPAGVDDASCVETFPDRYEHAVRVLSDVTPAETLEDAASPQGRALRWIVCEDAISSDLIDRREPRTGLLPRQAHGTASGAAAGEAWVRRRYALATVFFSTSEGGSWTERWNFLTPDAHECSWHHNYTRLNWPYGDVDPAGFVCMHQDDFIMLDDSEAKIHHFEWNFRVANNLTGSIPPEFGRIDDITWCSMERQTLSGSLPSTIGEIANLKTLSIHYAGPQFGGVLPTSLFTSPSLEYISINYNEGNWQFPPSIPLVPESNTSLLGLTVSSDPIFVGHGIVGTLPSYLSKLRSLKVLNFAGGLLEGPIPDSLGSLASLEFLGLQNNNLTGTLPQSLEQLSNLVTALLGENNLRGTLPSWLGNWSSLRLLDLSYNQFEGTVPLAFSQLSNLEHITLQHNKNLNGSISAFEPLERLSSLLLYENQFSSSIPQGLFSNFTGKIWADFGHNNFTGSLPETFSRWASNISYIGMTRNNFDANAIDEVICEKVPTLLADCRSSCSTYCCNEDSPDQDGRPCNFDLDFYQLTNLACGEWWMICMDEYVPFDEKPVNESD